MKRIFFCTPLVLLAGCAAQPQKPVPLFTPTQTQAVGDAVAQYALVLFPPASTKLHLSVPADADVARAVNDALAHHGYGVSDADQTEGIRLDYTVTPVGGGALVQVVTPGRTASCLLAGGKACIWTVRVEQ